MSLISERAPFKIQRTKIAESSRSALKIYEFSYNFEFCPWDPDDGSLRRIRDLAEIGVAVGPTWTPPAGRIRRIRGHRQGDFPFWLDPIFSDRARMALADLCDPHGEWLPLVTKGARSPYWIYNVTTVIDGLDQERSSLRRFPDGRVWAANRLVFDAARLPTGTHCFRLPEHVTSTFYVTEAFVSQVGAEGLRGSEPIEVWDSEAGSRWRPLI